MGKIQLYQLTDPVMGKIQKYPLYCLVRFPEHDATCLVNRRLSRDQAPIDSHQSLFSTYGK